MFDCVIMNTTSHMASEFSGDGRQTSQQCDLHRARALESEGPGSSLDLLAL